MIVSFAFLGVLIGTALVSSFLILGLKPLLIRYALARPNARSSHKVPTPQGGGIAVVGAGLIMACAILLNTDVPAGTFLGVAAAAVMLAIVGAVDDIRPLHPAPRLLLQVMAVMAVVLISNVRVFPDTVPLIVERIVLVIGGVWFVNLVNFMDGIDWITVAEMIPITAFFPLVALVATALAPSDHWFYQLFNPLVVWTSLALCGALLGFAPFNKPVARLFLGDVGSLPIGLLVGWMLLELAGTGALTAALLLPLYYLMDATITLLRRLRRREKVWEAHRSHFYQQATDNGFSALDVSAHVFGLNLVLAGLAAMTLVWPSGAVQIVALVLGAVLVGLVLRRFSTPRQTIPLEVSR
ncbi:glycosyl transferase [Microvirga terrestris]|uniref:Glycosyl transferase n=1 Tax=Microvirga terrestris TaxID=2791024 RepID=A0ABS0HTI9_9HYPH|nr:glycosyl transferase [Microvirga terrestris]MBF9196502.1 glycosyl transferase [Microvirga terrestris]